MPPALFAVWMFEAVGTVLSTVTEPVKLPVFPDTSVAVTVKDFAPSEHRVARRERGAPVAVGHAAHRERTATSATAV